MACYIQKSQISRRMSEIQLGAGAASHPDGGHMDSEPVNIENQTPVVQAQVVNSGVVEKSWDTDILQSATEGEEQIPVERTATVEDNNKPHVKKLKRSSSKSQLRRRDSNLKPKRLPRLKENGVLENVPDESGLLNPSELPDPEDEDRMAVERILQMREQGVNVESVSPEAEPHAAWKQKTRAAARFSRAVRSRNAPRETRPTDGAAEPKVSIANWLPPVRRARGGDINANVNGLRIFGIGKLGITRAVVKFSVPPPRQPYTVCFHFPSTFITHRYVLDMVKSKIAFLPGARVLSIQFVDRNAIHGTQGLDNRWLIKLNTMGARDELLRLGLQLYNRRITLRRYDDILSEEYKEYEQYMELQKKLYSKLDQMIKDKEAGIKVPLMPPNAANMSDDELKKVMTEQLNKAVLAQEARH